MQKKFLYIFFLALSFDTSFLYALDGKMGPYSTGISQISINIPPVLVRQVEKKGQAEPGSNCILSNANLLFDVGIMKISQHQPQNTTPPYQTRYLLRSQESSSFHDRTCTPKSNYGKILTKLSLSKEMSLKKFSSKNAAVQIVLSPSVL